MYEHESMKLYFKKSLLKCFPLELFKQRERGANRRGEDGRTGNELEEERVKEGGELREPPCWKQNGINQRNIY